MLHFCGWPYAAKAIIQHEYDTDHLNIWVTFRFPMRTSSNPLAEPPVHDVMPPLSLWLLETDDLPVNIISSTWQDHWTILLSSDIVAVRPVKVTLEYAGPHPNLETTWRKDWEPWGPILSTDLAATLWKTGMIILWSGSAASIPSGWHLCDGTEGTPNLRNNFIVGAGDAYAPGAIGGESSHTHTATQATHAHALVAGSGVAAGTGFTPGTSSATPAVTVAVKNTLPPYYALCYIMKL